MFLPSHSLGDFEDELAIFARLLLDRWERLGPTYGSQMTDIPGFKIVGFAGQPLPS
jgi:hypothetical protein